MVKLSAGGQKRLRDEAGLSNLCDAKDASVPTPPTLGASPLLLEVRPELSRFAAAMHR